MKISKGVIVDHVINGRNILFALLIIDNKDKGLSLFFINIQRVGKTLTFNGFDCVLCQHVHFFFTATCGTIRICVQMSTVYEVRRERQTPEFHCVQTYFLWRRRVGANWHLNLEQSRIPF